MRFSMLWTSARAPSAVWMTLIPSWAFRIAWFIPRIWARIFSEIASPAASSPARLILRPEESRSKLLLRLPSAIPNCRWVFIAEMLLTILITFLLLDYIFPPLPFGRPPQRSGRYGTSFVPLSLIISVRSEKTLQGLIIFFENLYQQIPRERGTLFYVFFHLFPQHQMMKLGGKSQSRPDCPQIFRG